MFFLMIAATLLACAHGFVSPTLPMPGGRIVGGSPAEITEAPYQVAILLDELGTGSYSFLCGGSIISRSVILTAAHCTKGTTESTRWNIRAGSTFHNSGGQVIAVNRIIKHSGYNSTVSKDNDVALFFLASQLTLGSGVAIITLPAQGQAVADGSSAFITGWGTLTEGESLSNQLYKVTIPIVNQQECVSAYASSPGTNNITNNMICAGRLGIGGIDSCQGDSGGPLAVDGILIGVTSWGRGCAQANYPGVYARVPSYIDWINSNM